LKPFPVASADMIELPNAMRAYKEVLSGAKNRIVLKP
jgi:hypothetical protein